MTSVQNLLQPLSGNKIIAFIFLSFLVTSCAVSSSKSARSGSTFITPQEVKKDSVRRKEDILPGEILPVIDSLAVIYKDTYNLAVVLPFYLDSIQTEPDTIGESKGIYPQSIMAVEFYQGLSLALDSLKRSGFGAEVHVFDSNNDPERVRQITLNPVLKDMDLIIGPVYNSELRVMADFAKKESIYMVSPLSPSNKITEANPYYVMVNPAIKVHCKKIFDYVMKNFSKQHIIVLSQPSSAELEYSREFKKLLDNYRETTGDNNVSFKEVLYFSKNAPVSEDEEDEPDSIDVKAESSDLKAELDLYRQNIVIVASVDKAYILDLSRKLNTLLEDHEIIVIGLPVWGEYQNLRLDYIDKLNVHFTSSFYVGNDFYTKDNPFYSFYIDSLKAEPSDYSIKGFDIMMFFGRMLQQFGIKFGEELIYQQAEGLHTRFKFGITPVENAALIATTDTVPQPVAIDFIENKYVHLLKYEKYSIVKVD